jgi:hypothetical protein
VNVSSAGEEISFLVPAEAVSKLLAMVTGSAQKGQKDFLEDIRQQLLSHQETYFKDGLIKSGQTTRLGTYQLPGQLAPFFKCWGDANHSEKLPYQVFNYRCSTDDYIYISGEHHSGVIRFNHRFVTSNEMNRFRFHNLYSSLFKDGEDGIYGNEEEVTKYECKSGTVRQGRNTFKTAFCMRGYRKLKGLYDVVFKAAVLGSGSSGMETTLEISGVSFEKAVKLTQGYLEAITWAK